MGELVLGKPASERLLGGRLGREDSFEFGLEGFAFELVGTGLEGGGAPGFEELVELRIFGDPCQVTVLGGPFIVVAAVVEVLIESPE